VRSRDDEEEKQADEAEWWVVKEQEAALWGIDGIRIDTTCEEYLTSSNASQLGRFVEA
jgi:hypothetical protein